MCLRVQVPLSYAALADLSDAVEAVETATDVDTPIRLRVKVVRAVDAALRTAEREVFDRLTRGPVYHFLQQSHYIVWAAEARVQLFEK